MPAKPIQNEVLVSKTTPTRLDPTPLFRRHTIAVQNLGPNTIWVIPGHASSPPTPVVNKCHKIVAGDFRSFDMVFTQNLWALAETADQVTGAATIVTEI